jgi:hypothetical protein
VINNLNLYDSKFMSFFSLRIYMKIEIFLKFFERADSGYSGVARAQ